MQFSLLVSEHVKERGQRMLQGSLSVSMVGEGTEAAPGLSECVHGGREDRGCSRALQADAVLVTH